MCCQAFDSSAFVGELLSFIIIYSKAPLFGQKLCACVCVHACVHVCVWVRACVRACVCERERENSNTLFCKDCSLGSVKNLTTSPC